MTWGRKVVFVTPVLNKASMNGISSPLTFCRKGTPGLSPEIFVPWDKNPDICKFRRSIYGENRAEVHAPSKLVFNDLALAIGCPPTCNPQLVTRSP
jgi:hypothetical protein